MVRPHAFQRWIDGAIGRGIPRLHTEEDEIRTRLLPDMVRRSRAKDFVIAPPGRSPTILLLEVAPNARAGRPTYRQPARGCTPLVSAHMGWRGPICSRCCRQTHEERVRWLTKI